MGRKKLLDLSTVTDWAKCADANQLKFSLPQPIRNRNKKLYLWDMFLIRIESDVVDTFGYGSMKPRAWRYEKLNCDLFLLFVALRMRILFFTGWNIN